MSGGNGIGPGPGAIKQQTIGLLHAVAYLRGRIADIQYSTTCTKQRVAFPRRVFSDNCLCLAVPLIAINALVILVKLLFG